MKKRIIMGSTLAILASACSEQIALHDLTAGSRVDPLNGAAPAVGVGVTPDASAVDAAPAASDSTGRLRGTVYTRADGSVLRFHAYGGWNAARTAPKFEPEAAPGLATLRDYLGLAAYVDASSQLSPSNARGESGCIVSAMGEVFCIGDNRHGQLGIGTTMFDVQRTSTSDSSDVLVQALGVSNVVGIGERGQHRCALIVDGTVQCWGINSHGELGRGTLSPAEPLAAPVVGLDHAVKLIGGHCALRDDASVWCWGAVPGSGVTSARTAFALAGATNVREFYGNQETYMFVRNDGTVWARGFNASSQLGLSAPTYGRIVDTQTQLPLQGVVTLSIASSYTCALRNTGSVTCFGFNGTGGLGLGTANPSLFGRDNDAGRILIAQNANLPGEPGGGADVIGLQDVVDISSSGWVSCALERSGGVFCWGGSSTGGISLDMSNIVLHPARVPGT